MTQAFDPKVLEILQSPSYATLSTLRADGSVHSVVVWMDVVEDGTILVNSGDGRAWPGNLRRDPRATITVPRIDDHGVYVSITGRVARITMGAQADADIDRLSLKYLGIPDYPGHIPGEERVSFNITPERVRYYAGIRPAAEPDPR